MALAGREQGDGEVHTGSPGRGGGDRVDDRLVAGAPAQMAGEEVGDLGAARRLFAVEQVGRGHQDPGRAEAALERVRLAKGGLQRRQLAAAREPLDRLELGSVDLHGEEEARAHGDAVEPHGARAADAVLATHVSPGEAERVPDEVGEQEPRLDRLTAKPAVDGDGDLDHAASRAASPRARRGRAR